ncbi:MAG TPA: YbhB/YbcL family Raf kinase inhibitor-like protein, partial [Polyangiaceae bacterium]|nr:YbhB/YbcL family Raf kinase inhibitor-like protein [Polyangiaceae bacterium]
TSSGGSSGSGGGSTGAFALTSPKLTEGAKFADEYTCASGNAGKSVPLTWTAGPSGTLSYAVILLDTNTMPPFNHWVIWDIPPTTTMLPEGLATDAMLTMPAGAKQKGGQGSGYLGPCPSGNSHVYKFTVYAMDVATLPNAMTSMATSALATAVQAHDLASASLSGNSDAKSPRSASSHRDREGLPTRSPPRRNYRSVSRPRRTIEHETRC